MQLARDNPYQSQTFGWLFDIIEIDVPGMAGTIRFLEKRLGAKRATRDLYELSDLFGQLLYLKAQTISQEAQGSWFYGQNPMTNLQLGISDQCFVQ